MITGFQLLCVPLVLLLQVGWQGTRLRQQSPCLLPLPRDLLKVQGTSAGSAYTTRIERIVNTKCCSRMKFGLRQPVPYIIGSDGLLSL